SSLSGFMSIRISLPRKETRPYSGKAADLAQARNPFKVWASVERHRLVPGELPWMVSDVVPIVSRGGFGARLPHIAKAASLGAFSVYSLRYYLVTASPNS